MYLIAKSRQIEVQIYYCNPWSDGKPQLLRILTSVPFILGKKNIEVDLNTQFNIGGGKSILRRKESNITLVKPEKHELETRSVQKLNHSISKVLSSHLVISIKSGVKVIHPKYSKY